MGLGLRPTARVGKSESTERQTNGLLVVVFSQDLLTITKTSRTPALSFKFHVYFHTLRKGTVTSGYLHLANQSIAHLHIQYSCSMTVHAEHDRPECCFQRDVWRKLLSRRKCLTLCWLENKETLQAFLGSAATSQPTGSLVVGGYFICTSTGCVCTCVRVCARAISCCYLHSLKVCMGDFSCVSFFPLLAFVRFPLLNCDSPDLSFVTLRGNMCIANTPLGSL